MPEPFKNWLGEGPIRDMAAHLARVEDTFDEPGFVAFAIDGLAGLELKERSSRIADALERFLPTNYRASAKVLIDSLDPMTNATVAEIVEGSTDAGISGWPVMPMADYISNRGQDDVEFSLEILRDMTTRSSSEFAIRPFLANHTQTTLAALHQWVDDDNEHVRRLVSEGSRPRLPWGMRLNNFVEDPAPVLDLLERLKDDPSEYVRRSVANNLNDIAKDHPGVVADVARRWMSNASADRQRLIRHALRTLIKAGHSGALETLGYGPPAVTLLSFAVLTPEVVLGGALEFRFELSSDAEVEQALMIDYVVHHMRANGETTPKVFKWKTTTLDGGASTTATRRHVMRPITTRRYYPGTHRVELQVNGQILGGAEFVLSI